MVFVRARFRHRRRHYTGCCSRVKLRKVSCFARLTTAKKGGKFGHPDARGQSARASSTSANHKQKGIFLESFDSKESEPRRGTVLALIRGSPELNVRCVLHRVPMTSRLVAWLGLVLALQGTPAACPAQETITNLWEVNLETGCDSSPAVGADGTIYFGTRAGTLWALDADGKRKWVFRTGREIKSSPAIGGDSTVYVGSRDRKFYAIGSDGKKRWEFKTGAWVDSSPALAGDGTICFGSWDWKFYALNRNGSKKWEFRTGGEIVSSPAIGVDGTVYFGSHDKKFYALGSDGQKKWEFATNGQIISSPALDKDEGLYFTAVDGFCYALNKNGSLRWRLRTGGITQSSPVIGLNGEVYVGVNGAVCAITHEGKKEWEWEYETAKSWRDRTVEASPVIFSDGSVCHSARSGLMITFTVEGHRMRWMCYAGFPGDASSAVGPTGTLYVPFARLGIQGFAALSTHVPLARTPWPRFRGNARNTGNARDSLP